MNQMRHIWYCIMIGFICSCNFQAQKKKLQKTQGEFRLPINQGSWTINIPEGFTVEDSAAYFNRLENTAYQEPAPGEWRGVMLYAYDRKGLKDTIYHALSISKYPWHDTITVESYARMNAAYVVRTTNLDTALQHLVDSSITGINIGGQPFMLENYTVCRGKDTVIFRYYHGIRERQLLMGYLHYYKRDSMGLKLREVVETSLFKDDN